MATPKIKQSCPHCPLRVDANRLQEHVIRCEMTKPHMCDIPECGRRFATPASVSAHKSKHHTAEERKTKYACRFCSHGSDDLKSLDKHEKMHTELGGPGFRHRSRSRSRGPGRSTSTLDDSTVAMDTSNTSSNVIETVPTPAAVENRQLPTTESIHILAHGAKPPEENRQLSTTESIRICAHEAKPVAARNRRSTSADSESIRTQNGEERKSRSGNPNNAPQNDRTSGEFEPPMIDANIPNVSNEPEETVEEIEEEVQMVPVIPPVPMPPQFDRNYLMSVAMLNPEYAERRFQQYKDTHDDIVRQIRKQNKMVREFCKENGIGLSENDPIEKQIKDQYGKLADENVESGGR